MKFDSLYARIVEDVAPTTQTAATPATTPAAAGTQPVTNTPAVYDQQHPIVQALTKANNPQSVIDALKQYKIVLPSTAAPTTPAVTPSPNAA
jgi:hypothetical protein